MRKLAWLGVCSLVLGLGASIAPAQVITVAVTGHVSHIDDPSLGLTVGQAVTGSYSYDTSTPSSGPANHNSGLEYQFASPPTNITVAVAGGQTYQTQNAWTFEGSVINSGFSQIQLRGCELLVLRDSRGPAGRYDHRHSELVVACALVARDRAPFELQSHWDVLCAAAELARHCL